MKTTILSALLVLGLSFFFKVIAQEIPDPDFSKKPYYLKDGKLAEFEKSEADLSRKMKGLGYGGTEFYYSVPGSNSATRFPATSIPKLIIKTEDNSDPTEAMLICSGVSKNNSRQFKSFTMNAFGGTKGATDNRVKVSVKKLRDKIFEVTIDQSLPIGEYAIVPYSSDATAMAVTTGIKVACFGID